MLIWLNTMPWWVWSIVANLAINVIEFLNRTGGFATPLVAFRTTGPLIILAQVGLFYAWKGAPSMMLAWACFSAMNSLMRLVSNHYFVGEPLSVQGWAGCALMFAGMYVVKTAK